MNVVVVEETVAQVLVEGGDAPAIVAVTDQVVAVVAVAEQGPEGRPGRDAAAPTVAIVCADAILGPGVPVFVDRSSGHLRLARADTYRASFVLGVGLEATAPGFACPVQWGSVTLADWSAATGVPDLRAGLVYYLGAGGGLVTDPPIAPGNTIVTVGRAATARTLTVMPSNPIML